MNRIQVRIAAAGLAVLSLVALAAACGGSGTSSAATTKKINLVAYSTPEASYAKLIPAFQKTSGRQGHELHPVLWRIGRPKPCGRRRPGRRCRPLRPRAGHRPARPGQAGELQLGSGPVQGHRCRHDGRVRRTQGESQAHHHVGRPRQEGRPGHHAQPVHLGRRPLERHGGIRRRGQGRQDAGPGAAVSEPALPQRPGAGRQGVGCAPDVHRRQGRRAACLRAGCAAGTAERQRHPDRVPAADDRDPDADRDDGQGACGRQVVRQVALHPRRADDPRADRLPAGCLERRVRVHQGVAEHAEPDRVHHHRRRPGGWSDVSTKFFDPTSSIMQKIEESIGVSTSS